MLKSILRIVLVSLGVVISYIAGVFIYTLIKLSEIRPPTVREVGVVILIILLGYCLILAGLGDD